MTMKKNILFVALMAALMCTSAQAQVVAEESAANNPDTVVNYQPIEVPGSFGYGLYAGAGYSAPTSGLNDNFGGNFLFQIGAVGTYDRFQLKTDVQFGQPGYRNSNILGAPDFDDLGHASQVNSSSSASFFAWSLQVGYKVYEKGRFAVTPNAGVYFTKYSWNVNNLSWEKNDDGEYEATVQTTQSAKLSNLGFIASVDVDYTFSTTKVKNPFTGNGDNQLKQSIRFTPFVAYAKYDKCSPSVKGAFVGITVNYLGLLHSLGF